MLFFGEKLDIRDCDRDVSGAVLRGLGQGRRFMTLDELLPILCDPNSKEALRWSGDRLVSTSGSYAVGQSGPLLYPVDMSNLDAAMNGGLFLERYRSLSPKEQYFLLGALKASMGTNLDAEDAWYKRHLWRSCRLLKDVRGGFLDIGCDDSWLSRGMLHEEVDYVGIEPSVSGGGAFCIHGFSEFLPIATAAFDSVGFQTSLDHVLDFRLAIDEACRVLRPKGKLYLATLLWTGVRAQLYTDTVHFHHFRPKDIEAVLEKDFSLERVDAYSWKGDSHRCGVYLVATKR